MPDKRRIRVEIPGYQMIAKLGQGGMGAVFKAKHIETGKFVAIKILAPNVARIPKFVQRFEREARLAAALKHENAIGVVDCGQANRLHYIAMDFVDGGDVENMLKDGAIPQDKAINIACGVGRALAAAHERGIIHRDIKPANIMMTQDGVPKLCDLGVTKQTGGSEVSLTKTGTAMGTPAYVSPEQIMDAKHIDARTDVYSLGATTYHMVVGERPFKADTAVDMMLKQATEPVEPPHKRNPNVSERLSQVILHAMEKKPDDRYQSLNEMLADLEAVQRGEAPKLASAGQAVPAAAAAAPGLDDIAATIPEASSLDASTRPLAQAAPAERRSSAWVWILLLLLLAGGGTAGWFYGRPYLEQWLGSRSTVADGIKRAEDLQKAQQYGAALKALDELAGLQVKGPEKRDIEAARVQVIDAAAKEVMKVVALVRIKDFKQAAAKKSVLLDIKDANITDQDLSLLAGRLLETISKNVDTDG